jgi:hypothetical protein
MSEGIQIAAFYPGYTLGIRIGGRSYRGVTRFWSRKMRFFRGHLRCEVGSRAEPGLQDFEEAGKRGCHHRFQDLILCEPAFAEGFQVRAREQDFSFLSPAQRVFR